MNYILMHRKIEVAEIEISGKRMKISAIGKVFNYEHLPIGITVNAGVPDIEDLDDWWRGRSIPASRPNFLEAMEHMGVSSSAELLIKCFGLSLSDQYWVNPKSNPLEWKEINFFDNAFSEDVGNTLFQETTKGKPLNLLAPDNSSDGVLKKRWKIIEGKRFLIKGGSDPFHQEPCNEAIATAIMKRLLINHIPYSVILEKGTPYSVCENFITSNTELVSGFYIHNIKRIKSADNFYEHFLDCCSELEIPNVREDFDKMLTLDYLIANKDRHMSNFGAVRNAETLEWLGLAPVFDSGTSLWHNKLEINAENAPCSRPFLDTHEAQIKAVKDFSWLDLSALKGIENEFHEIFSHSPYIDEKRIHALCKAFKSRVKSLEEYVQSL
ncbi:MAG: excisionase [Oscillospiraceae bacterium]|nr:excisionase [Oscillospiraceae bacterium]